MRRILGVLLASGVALAALAVFAAPSDADLGGPYGDDDSNPLEFLSGGLDDPLDAEPLDSDGEPPYPAGCHPENPPGAWGDCYPVDLQMTFDFDTTHYWEYKLTYLGASNCTKFEGGSGSISGIGSTMPYTDPAQTVFWARTDGGCAWETSSAWFAVEIGNCTPDCTKLLGDPWIRHINIHEEHIGPHADYSVTCGPGGLPCVSTGSSEDSLGRRTVRVSFFSAKGDDLTYPTPDV